MDDAMKRDDLIEYLKTFSENFDVKVWEMTEYGNFPHDIFEQRVKVIEKEGDRFIGISFY